MKKEKSQRIISNCHKQPYTNKMGNIEEKDRFLKMYNLSRQNEQESGNINKPITSNETETVIKNFPTTDGFT